MQVCAVLCGSSAASPRAVTVPSTWPSAAVRLDRSAAASPSLPFHGVYDLPPLGDRREGVDEIARALARGLVSPAGRPSAWHACGGTTFVMTGEEEQAKGDLFPAVITHAAAQLMERQEATDCVQRGVWFAACTISTADGEAVADLLADEPTAVPLFRTVGGDDEPAARASLSVRDDSVYGFVLPLRAVRVHSAGELRELLTSRCAFPEPSPHTHGSEAISAGPPPFRHKDHVWVYLFPAAARATSGSAHPRRQPYIRAVLLPRASAAPRTPQGLRIPLWVRSLSAVMSAIELRAASVPFASSKVTALLREAFSGEGRFLLAAVAPDHPTIGAAVLQFARRWADAYAQLCGHDAAPVAEVEAVPLSHSPSAAPAAPVTCDADNAPRTSDDARVSAPTPATPPVRVLQSSSSPVQARVAAQGPSPAVRLLQRPVNAAPPAPTAAMATPEPVQARIDAVDVSSAESMRASVAPSAEVLAQPAAQGSPSVAAPRLPGPATPVHMPPRAATRPAASTTATRQPAATSSIGSRSGARATAARASAAARTRSLTPSAAGRASAVSTPAAAPTALARNRTPGTVPSGAASSAGMPTGGVPRVPSGSEQADDVTALQARCADLAREVRDYQLYRDVMEAALHRLQQELTCCRAERDAAQRAASVAQVTAARERSAAVTARKRSAALERELLQLRDAAVQSRKEGVDMAAAVRQSLAHVAATYGGQAAEAAVYDAAEAELEAARYREAAFEATQFGRREQLRANALAAQVADLQAARQHVGDGGVAGALHDHALRSMTAHISAQHASVVSVQHAGAATAPAVGLHSVTPRASTRAGPPDARLASSGSASASHGRRTASATRAASFTRAPTRPGTQHAPVPAPVQAPPAVTLPVQQAPLVANRSPVDGTWHTARPRSRPPSASVAARGSHSVVQQRVEPLVAHGVSVYDEGSFEAAMVRATGGASSGSGSSSSSMVGAREYRPSDSAHLMDAAQALAYEIRSLTGE